LNKKEKQLLSHFRSLSPDAAETLLSFAEFLTSRESVELSVPLSINNIERPADETVIAAIKRLSESYPMLDKDKILHETSALMAQHMLQGREAQDVIDDLEQVFRQHYDSFSTTTD